MASSSSASSNSYSVSFERPMLPSLRSLHLPGYNDGSHGLTDASLLRESGIALPISKAEDVRTRQFSIASTCTTTSRLSSSPSSSFSTAPTSPSSSPPPMPMSPSKICTPSSYHPTCSRRAKAIPPVNLGSAPTTTTATATIVTNRCSHVRFRLEIADSFDNADAAVIFPPPTAPHIPHVSTISTSTSTFSLPSPRATPPPSVGPRSSSSATCTGLRPRIADPLLLLGRNGLRYLRSPECKLAAGTRVHPYRVVVASVGGRARTHAARPLRKTGTNGADAAV
ncbi:uncharacterized protein STEHIDRAFT_109105 [Stereum hirsutum FP-91666 SS1]|uniref:uncharacterized protein n=1 Tax=Stereum hirsutum (strain FP-91666) TaxID=721885 RepID=UPI000440F66F|nr:uncharacterized protein STEHIDRAFT_109105 [Stereum hirsutum FP-91666 SS1]EIM88758.1 hypothetical protein STEHIDRAFT_109105 [Stereum hirsutum FP-91666 SS1]